MLNNRNSSNHNFYKPEATRNSDLHFNKIEATFGGSNFTKPERIFASTKSPHPAKAVQSIERKTRAKEGSNKRDGSYFGKVSAAT